MLTFVYTYYNNPKMLAHQYQIWASYSDELKKKIRIVIVDDASVRAAVDVPRPEALPITRIYRVLVDKPWHQDGARNLGAHVASMPWLFCCDIDHALPEKYLARLLHFLKDADQDRFYTFNRIEVDGTPTLDKNTGQPKPAFNIFAITRDIFWSVGGYDEDYTGYYGTDGMFRRRLLKKAKQQHLKQVSIVRYGRKDFDDANTALPRKGPANTALKDRLLAEKIARGRKDVITSLDFDWREECL